MLTLRPYQQRAIAELYAWLERHNTGNPIVNMCVGAGKSVVIAELCRQAIDAFPQTRIVMAVASQELCKQNLEKLKMIWHDAPAGICSAALKSNDLDSQIIFSTIGSIAKKAHLLGRCDILLVDECHNINTKAKGMYRQFIDDLKRYGNKKLCVIGFTGTPFRGNGIWLHSGDNPLFHGIATTVTMDELLNSGHLSPLIVDNDTPMIGDLSSVRINAGDYIIADLNNVLNDDQLIADTVSDIIKRGQNRKKWLVFCVTVEHAQNVTDEFCRQGIHAKMIEANTPNDVRTQIIHDYKHGHLRCLVNIATLTTGFDAPKTDLIALLRPTKSPVLYVQIAGRGMRIDQDKTDCLWLDYTPTTAELGPVNQIKGRVKRDSHNDASKPVKYCDNCGNPNPISAKECMDCGYPFEIAYKAPHQNTPNIADILQLAPKVPKRQWYTVSRVLYQKHSKDPSKPPTFKVTYQCGLFSVSEYKAFEHTGFARTKALEWWTHKGRNPHRIEKPETVDDAIELSSELVTPTKIQVQENGKYWNVISYEFASTEELEKLPF